MPTDEMGIFVSKILWTTEQVWQAKFREAGKRYEKPKLVLYNNQTPSACGMGAAVMGPFYCPTDHKVYLDTSFFHALDLRYDAPGNFAQAYVIAHEVGHHVQALLGIEKRVFDAQSKMSERDANQLNVRLELQADCLAGIWASWLRQLPGVMEPGDIEAALRATQVLGDDMIQKQTTGTVVLDSFTHGSGDQRARWFKRGLDTGKLEQCDTFSAPEL
jgi:predicted metalloprotease